MRERGERVSGRAFFREFLPDNRVADNMIKEPLGDPLA